MKKKRVFFLIVAIVFMMNAPIILLAADDPGPINRVDDTVPIDGGLSLLLAAGVGYGIKKIRDGRKERKQTDQLSK